MAVTFEEIERVLDEKVRPELRQHGGNISVDRFEDGVLHVRLTGACSGCPSADLTMEQIVNEELKAAISEIKQVALVTGVSDEMLDMARSILAQRHKDKP